MQVHTPPARQPARLTQVVLQFACGTYRGSPKTSATLPSCATVATRHAPTLAPSLPLEQAALRARGVAAAAGAAASADGELALASGPSDTFTRPKHILSGPELSTSRPPTMAPVIPMAQAQVRARGTSPLPHVSPSRWAKVCFRVVRWLQYDRLSLCQLHGTNVQQSC